MHSVCHRIENLRSVLLEDTSAVLITSNINRYYYSNFKSSAGAILVTKNTATLLVDFRYFEVAQKTVKEPLSVVCYKKLFDEINLIIDKESIKSVIIEEGYVTVNQLKIFEESIKANVIHSFNLSEKILGFRMIKSTDEISLIKKAQEITEKSFLEILNHIKVGITERQIAIELEHIMKLNGAEGLAFDIISVAGKNTSLPHGVPTDNKINNGDFITFDIGSVYNGYHSDMTRTVALGYVTDEMQEVYDIVLNAHHLASKAIFKGNTCADVDNAARGYIISMGYGEFFGHSTGHGVGLEIHEKPTVYCLNNEVLKPGMVITDEPGIYLPDKFGVRIEDMYLVTDNGYEDLAHINKELIIL
ncbi:MAG: aminopeptidase P family protein [Ruminococcaceae bacterium]|nr:aminopeptidase P family protein [Oscillospiraceae bacterium]